MIDRGVASELVGTALLLFVIVGSGVAVEQLAADPAPSLFYHAVAVGLGLAVLIALFARTSGAHFNPAVTLALWRRRSIGGQTALPYIGAQVVGAVLGLTVALVSFGDRPALSTTEGLDWGSVLAEYVGTTVLALLIVGAIDQGRLSWVPAMVGGWVTVMVFSSSTGLLNPRCHDREGIHGHIHRDPSSHCPGVHLRPASRRPDRGLSIYPTADTPERKGT
jgi:glycerol uptake facilitator-like aquaporin